MCKYYSRLWDRTAQLVPLRAFAPTNRQPTEFPRIEIWQKRRPPTGGKHACKCGCSDDAFKCYIRTQAGEAMGENRREVGGMLLVDSEVLGDEDGAVS